MQSKLISENQFRLSNGLIIDLSLSWEEQKKKLGKNIFDTGSSFGCSYPELDLFSDRYDPVEWKVLEKNQYDHHYYVIDYEYDLSKVRTVKVYNQFSETITLWERHNTLARLFGK